MDTLKFNVKFNFPQKFYQTEVSYDMLYLNQKSLEVTVMEIESLSPVNHSRVKLLNLIIYFTKNTKHCGITKLCKLLYFADFKHFQETGKSITSSHYFAWKWGPVPVEVYFELKEPKKDFKEKIAVSKLHKREDVKGKCAFDSTHFTERELKIMRDIAFIFQEANAEDMSEISHLKNQPWQKTIETKGERKEISFELALDGTPGTISLEEYRDKVSDIEDLRELLYGAR